MSRIRSIHPGFKTDEEFVAISRDARLFYLLLLGECDDQGIFEWKPTTLKMRIFPADNVDIAALLSELEGINAIKNYEIDGRKLGIVRNFRKYQRPKSPNAVYLKPDDWGNYVGLNSDDGEIDTPSGAAVSPNSGKPSAEGGGRREEGGGNGKESEFEEKRAPARAAAAKGYAFEGRVIKLNEKDLRAWQLSYHAIPDLQAELQAIDDKFSTEPPGKSWFGTASAWLRTKHEKLLKERQGSAGGGATPLFGGEEDRQKNLYEARVKGYRANGLWLSDWGPKPADDVSRGAA